MKHNLENSTMREALEQMKSICRGYSSRRTIEWLAAQGALSERSCKAVLIRRKVKELTDLGCGKVVAMERVAEENNLSYGTVRSYVYSRAK